MDIDKLNKINSTWCDRLNTYSLYKTAGLVSEAGDMLGRILDTAKGAGKTLLYTTPVLAGLGAIAYNKITTPKALADNADKELLKATLDKEIAVWERYIADEKERLEKETTTKKYDRFI